MGRFLPRSSEISVQAPGSNSHTKPELPVLEKSQETTKAQPVTTSTSTPSWTASVCKPPTLQIPPSLPILQDLALPTPQPITRLAGRTALHLPVWEKITSNQWTLQAIKGYKLEFKDQPQQSHRPQTVETSHQSRVISEEVQKLLEKGAIQEVSENEDGFYSRLFLVPKKDGQMRPVINLRPLNQFWFRTISK